LARSAKLAKPFREKRNELVGFFDREKASVHAFGSLAKMSESTKKKRHGLSNGGSGRIAPFRCAIIRVLWASFWGVMLINF
jgi:hypothetical protein